jgi:hypothetical protein
MGRGDATTRALIGSSIGALCSIFTAAVLVGLRGDIVNVNVALVLVICILLGAVTGGRAAGAMSAFVAGLAYDFFHTEPYGSLKIRDANDILTICLLIAVGVVAGEIAIRAQRFYAERNEEQQQLRQIQHIASLAAGGGSVDDFVLAVTAELRKTLALRSCWFERPPFLVRLPRLERTGAVCSAEHRWAGDAFELPRDGAVLEVCGHGQMLGRFILVPTRGIGVSKERRLNAVALADQAAAALVSSAA